MSAIDPAIRPTLNHESIADLCRRFEVQRLEIFGSALRDDFGPGSDVDFLVVFRDDGARGPVGFQDFQDELSRVLGRKIDLLSRKAVEGSANYVLRRSILSTARPIYVAR